MTSASPRRPLAIVLSAIVVSATLVAGGRAIFGPVVGGPAAFAGPAGPAGTAVAADHFLESWRRSLITSWSEEESVDRTTRNGRRLTFVVHRAQRPPDRLMVGLGSVDARLGQKRTACATTSSRALSCRSVSAPTSYDQEVASEMGTLVPYVRGAVPLYAVAQLAGCFQLSLRLPGFPVPPYGRRAVFCFDPLTGAPAGSVVSRDEGTDRTTVTEVHVPATDADLRVPASAQVTSQVQAS